MRGHQFVEISYHTPSNCDVCSKTLPWSLNIMKKGECSYECQRCHLKCHKEHTERNVDTMQPCVGGEQNIKRQLLLIKDSDELERWYGQLSRITLNSSSADSAANPPLLRKNSRTGSMRLAGTRRPGSTSPATRPPGNITIPVVPNRSHSVSVNRLRDVHPRDSVSSEGPCSPGSRPSTYSHSHSKTKFRQPLPDTLLRTQNMDDYSGTLTQ